MATSDGSLGIRYDKRARNISENIVLETKTLPFSQWLPVYAFAQRHCLSGTELHKFHRFDRVTSNKEAKTEKINNLLP